jgi:hypothetical protein
MNYFILSISQILQEIYSYKKFFIIFLKFKFQWVLWDMGVFLFGFANQATQSKFILGGILLNRKWEQNIIAMMNFKKIMLDFPKASPQKYMLISFI